MPLRCSNLKHTFAQIKEQLETLIIRLDGDKRRWMIPKIPRKNPANSERRIFEDLSLYTTSDSDYGCEEHKLMFPRN